MANIKLYRIKDLKPGMYIIDTQPNIPPVPPLFSVEGYILSYSDAISIEKLGYTHAYVNEEIYLHNDEAFDDHICDEDLQVPSQLIDSLKLNKNIITESSYSKNLKDLQEELRPKSEVDIQLEPGTVFDLSAPYELPIDTPFQNEIEKAKVLHDSVTDIAHDLWGNVQRGLPIQDVDVIEKVISETVQSIIRNQNAMLCMANLKQVNEYTFSHSVNVFIYATVLGRRLKVTEESLYDLALSAFMHDVGKMLIPQQILNYKGRLNSDAFEIMKQHVLRGANYLEQFPDIAPVVRIGILDHHERFNGQGYPNKKRYNEISLIGQILSVADVYDAMTSERCYKKAYPPEKALAIMYKDRGTTFSPGLLEMFIDAMGVYPVGNLVKLSNNHLAVVTERGVTSPLRPTVVTLIGPTGQAVKEPTKISLDVHRNIAILNSIVNLPRKIDVEKAVWVANGGE